MIQLNLLPDIKLEYLRAQRTKRFFILTSMVVSGGAIAVVVLMALFVYGIQARHSANLDRDIGSNIEALEATPNLSQILTVQNQLDELPNLHDAKPTVSRMFDYFTVLVPDEVDLNSLDLRYGKDGADTALEFTGVSEDFKSVNQFADSLKNAQFTSDQFVDSELAFSKVTLETIGKNQDETVFSIIVVVEPEVFQAGQDNLKLTVPSIVSSPSVTERPSNLFNQQNTGGEDQ